MQVSPSDSDHRATATRRFDSLVITREALNSNPKAMPKRTKAPHVFHLFNRCLFRFHSRADNLKINIFKRTLFIVLSLSVCSVQATKFSTSPMTRELLPVLITLMRFHAKF